LNYAVWCATDKVPGLRRNVVLMSVLQPEMSNKFCMAVRWYALQFA